MDKVKDILHVGSSSSSTTTKGQDNNSESINSSSSKNEPAEPSAEALAALRARYTQAGQGHVLDFYDSLPGRERAAL
ncbi:hypothetical protein E4U41_005345, partial [Claviceps citrina]